MAVVFKFGVQDDVSANLERMGEGLNRLADEADAAQRSTGRWTAAIGATAVAVAKHRLVINGLRETVKLYERTAGDTSGLQGMAKALRYTELAAQGTGRAVASTGRDLVQMAGAERRVVHALQNIRLQYLGMETAAGRATRATQQFLLENERGFLRKRALATVVSAVPGAEAAVGAAGSIGRLAFGGARLATSSVAVGATGAIAAYQGVLARTGMRESEKEVKARTDEFKRLEEVARRTGTAIEIVMAEAGKSWDDFRTKITGTESNLDRVGLKFDEFKARVVRTFTETGAAANALFAEPVRRAADKAWKYIDDAATRGADNIRTNIGLVGDAYQTAVDNVRAFAGSDPYLGFAQETTKQMKGLRELADWHVKMDELRAKERKHFDGLRAANQELATAARGRAAAERILSIASIAGIDAEIQRTKELAGQQLIDFDTYKARLTVLQTIRERMDAADVSRRKRSADEEAERRRKDFEDATKLRQQQIDADTRAVNKAYEEHKALQRRADELDREFAAGQRQRVLETVEQRLKAEGGAAEDIAAIQRAQINAQLEDELAAARSEEDQLEARHRHRVRLAELETRIHRDALDKQVRDRQEAAEKELQAAKAKHEALKGLIAEEGGFSEAVQQAVDPSDVQKAFAEQRGAEAAAAFAADKGKNFDLSDPRQQARFQTRQKQVARQAMKAANAQWNMGNVSEDQYNQAQAQAQQQAAGELIHYLGKSGQVDQQTLSVLQEQVQALSETQRAQEEQGRALAQLRAAISSQRETAQRQRAQAGSWQ